MLEFLLLCLLYILPTILAICNKNTTTATTILFVNLFFGWSIVGWFFCLLWSLSKNENNLDNNNLDWELNSIMSIYHCDKKVARKIYSVRGKGYHITTDCTGRLYYYNGEDCIFIN